MDSDGNFLRLMVTTIIFLMLLIIFGAIVWFEADAGTQMLIAIGNLRPETTLLPRAFRRNIKEFVSFESY